MALKSLNMTKCLNVTCYDKNIKKMRMYLVFLIRTCEKMKEGNERLQGWLFERSIMYVVPKVRKSRLVR